MKKIEIWEGVIILLSAVLLLPIWLSHSQQIVFPGGLLRVFKFLQIPVVVVLGVICVRRVRRIIHAIRDNKNRPGPF